jgi:hypothetical protein
MKEMVCDTLIPAVKAVGKQQLENEMRTVCRLTQALQQLREAQMKIFELPKRRREELMMVFRLANDEEVRAWRRTQVPEGPETNWVTGQIGVKAMMSVDLKTINDELRLALQIIQLIT